jgi:hypothetical protein
MDHVELAATQRILSLILEGTKFWSRDYMDDWGLAVLIEHVLPWWGPGTPYAGNKRYLSSSIQVKYNTWSRQRQ